MNKPEKQHAMLAVASAVVLSYVYFTDPNNGALLPAFLGQLAMPVIAVWFAYLMRKVLSPYIRAEDLLNKAKETSVGSGIAYLGICIVMYGLLGLFGSQAHAESVKTYIPKQASEHLPTLRKEQVAQWADHPFSVDVSQSNRA